MLALHRLAPFAFSFALADGGCCSNPEGTTRLADGSHVNRVTRDYAYCMEASAAFLLDNERSTTAKEPVDAQRERLSSNCYKLAKNSPPTPTTAGSSSAPATESTSPPPNECNLTLPFLNAQPDVEIPFGCGGFPADAYALVTLDPVIYELVDAEKPAGGKEKGPVHRVFQRKAAAFVVSEPSAETPEGTLLKVSSRGAVSGRVKLPQCSPKEASESSVLRCSFVGVAQISIKPSIHVARKNEQPKPPPSP